VDTKRRRKFFLYDQYNYPKAMGLLYNEGNVQILWRSDIGWTGEQYNDIRLVLDIREGITQLKFQDTP
jgi:hypothetical protein